MAILIEESEYGLQKQLDHFVSKIDKYTSFLELNEDKVNGIKVDCLATKYVNMASSLLKTKAKSVNSYKRTLRYGGKIGDLPLAPIFPNPVPESVPAGVEKRFRDIIHAIMKSEHYTDDIGKDLGIIALETTVDLDNVQPIFSIGITALGHPLLDWQKGDYHGIEIWKSTDGINFTKHDKAFFSDTVDKSSLPALGRSEIWYYKMIYLFKDEWIGKWSDVKSIAVIGQ